MISAIIVDDEQKSISTLQKIIEDYCPQMKVVGTANAITNAKSLIEALKPQLVFLDVEMPYGNGFDLLNTIEPIDFEIVFITAYNQYAINAFKYAAIDYLLKPVNIAQLISAVERAEKRISEKINAGNYLLLKQNLNTQQSTDQCIILADNSGQHFIKIKDICYCIADGSYAFIYLITGKRYHASKHLKEFEEMLPSELFFRVHHGHIVNVNYVAKFIKGRVGTVIMQDGKELEVAVRRKNDFIAFMSK